MSHRKDLIDYRRIKAKETFADSRILYDSKSYSSSVNRIYYAVFYEVTALLLTKDLSSAKHSGTRSLFNEYFVKTNVISSESGKFYGLLFDFRQKGDYGDFTVFEDQLVKELLGKAEVFLSEIEGIIEKMSIQ